MTLEIFLVYSRQKYKAQLGEFTNMTLGVFVAEKVNAMRAAILVVYQLFKFLIFSSNF